MFLNGRHLRAARVMAGMSQEQLAEAADLHRNSVRYWEKASHPLPADAFALWQFREALHRRGVSVDIVDHAGKRVAIVQKGQ